MSSEAQRRASATYEKKRVCKKIAYNIQEIGEIQKIEMHCKSLGITYQRYVKQLIRDDMKNWE